MKQKAADKLFYLAYTDIMTGTHNRDAYEEYIKKLGKKDIRLDNMSVIELQLDNLNEIKYVMGNRTADESVRLTASCIKRTLGERADIYRLSECEFICIADTNIIPYVSELYDLIGFDSRDKKIPLSVLIGYMRFDKKKHENIYELIKDCDRQLIKERDRA